MHHQHRFGRQPARQEAAGVLDGQSFISKCGYGRLGHRRRTTRPRRNRGCRFRSTSETVECSECPRLRRARRLALCAEERGAECPRRHARQFPWLRNRGREQRRSRMDTAHGRAFSRQSGNASHRKLGCHRRHAAGRRPDGPSPPSCTFVPLFRRAERQTLRRGLRSAGLYCSINRRIGRVRSSVDGRDGHY